MLRPTKPVLFLPPPSLHLNGGWSPPSPPGSLDFFELLWCPLLQVIWIRSLKKAALREGYSQVFRMSEVPSKEAMFDYRGTSLTRKCSPLGPYREPMPRAPWCSKGGGCFL